MCGVITTPRACASEQIISLHLTNRVVDISEKLASVCFKPSDLQMPMSIISGVVVVFLALVATPIDRARGLLMRITTGLLVEIVNIHCDDVSYE